MSQQRVGKYRHVFGKKQFKEVYDDLRLGVAHAESYMIKANKHFIACKSLLLSNNIDNFI